MKREHDFSKAVRGRFYRPSLQLNIPVYLDKDVLAFVGKIAQNRQTDLSAVVNQLLRTDLDLVNSAK